MSHNTEMLRPPRVCNGRYKLLLGSYLDIPAEVSVIYTVIYTVAPYKFWVSLYRTADFGRWISIAQWSDASRRA
jgi:hypothetical protein